MILLAHCHTPNASPCPAITADATGDPLPVCSYSVIRASSAPQTSQRAHPISTIRSLCPRHHPKTPFGPHPSGRCPRHPTPLKPQETRSCHANRFSPTEFLRRLVPAAH